MQGERVIDESRVVPVIGADLLRVEHEGRHVCLDLLIARRLAARLDVPPAGLPKDDALNAVISRYIETGGSREDIYVRLNKASRFRSCASRCGSPKTCSV